MKIYTNQRVVRRNSQIGKWTLGAGFLILIGGAIVSYTMPMQFTPILAAFLVGFTLSQVGIYFSNRWGRSPRVDENLNISLKGLPREYSLYHYLTATAHLMVGPAGIWVFIPYYQRGTISYEKNRWRQRGGGLLLAYLKIFAQEGLGRPDLDAQAELDGAKRFLQKGLEDSELPDVNLALVFTDARAEVQADNAPIPTLRAGDLKDFLRRYAKAHPFPSGEIERIGAILPRAEE